MKNRKYWIRRCFGQDDLTGGLLWINLLFQDGKILESVNRRCKSYCLSYRR